MAIRKYARNVRFDGCVFDLHSIPESETKTYMRTGRYELSERRLVTKFVRPDLPVVELGGGIGVVACITNRLLATPRTHRIVEANPQAVGCLERNRKRNGCNFEVRNAAIAYGTEKVSFRPSSDLWASATNRAGDMPLVTVDAIHLAALTDDLDAFTLICDIEGEECELVRNEAEVVKRAETIILETHSRLIGEAPTEAMMVTLRAIGFTVVEECGFVVVLQKRN